ncbi:xanthine dehydrogenase family protein molybdopterin-binding subunit [Acidicapsa dinghuensis]|uniref:Xanthine dehydrogenase family protein molybdopterin-binding subunit n=1 Tax=Acidicapsa dinghuensis TaxID=2218256 RepID=A0ABW1EBP0_9BACT|nr:xanthine dehydrogenase family protein molybdopterin-binding subunit [Acidicapsa dinghuensis]
MPDAALYTPTAIIGSELPRIDGPLKTSGTAMYAADYHFPHLVHGVPVTSTVAAGKIRSIDTSAAEKMPGVLLVITHDNVGPLFRMAPGGHDGRTSESRPPLEDDIVRYWGQYVAMVVAETIEQAQIAAHAIKVDYDPSSFNVSKVLDDSPTEELPLHTESKRGDAISAFASAPVKIDQTYVTPAETHNPMEMHATVAVWNNPKFTLYETTQGVMNHQHVMAETLGVPRENIQVITRFLGSGFGGKLFPWPHSALAAAAARQLNRPVKVSTNRQMMFQNVGHRPRTQQHMQFSATPDGKLVSLRHDYRNHTNLGDDIHENCGEATPFIYSVPNLLLTSALVRRNVGTPTPMRGPGAVPGLFAVESAMDELAIALKMDPVEFRLKNDTLTDESNGKPFSSRHLKECLQLGSEKFGWSKRNPKVGSMCKPGDPDVILGWGVAAASWGAGHGPCQASVALLNDGTARVSCGTQDVGTGTYTIFAQIVSDRTGIPIDKVRVVIGDSALPPGPTSGGSTCTATVLPAIAEATDNAIKVALATAATAKDSPFHGKKPDGLAFHEARVHLEDRPASTGTPYQQLLKMANIDAANGEGSTSALNSNPEARKYSTHSFGAQFIEVEWDPGIARLRVSRVVSVIDGGRMINKKTAENQILGAVVMGIGMGMLEETIYTPKTGQPLNSNYADYMVPTHADSPSIEVHFIEYPDPILGEYGARGIGEIGLAGVAPAITAAVYHATGVRVRELPVRIERLMQSTVQV